MDGPSLRREVGAPARKRLRAALVVCATISGLSLGMSLAALHAAGKVVSLPRATPPDRCGEPRALRATVGAVIVEKYAFLDWARSVRAIAVGPKRGWRIDGIVPDSLGSMIGLQNGDIVRAIRPGLPVTLYIERGGCPISIVVDVQ
jgi:hypothetical protein